ncbi:MAG: protease complex subunit PrcB family protein [Candidatus Competibacteraceae bacterium]
MKRLAWMTLMILLMSAGCAQPEPGANATLPVQSSYSDSQCVGLERPTVMWIADAETWRSWYGRITSTRLPAPPPPAVDFSREGVLLLAMGSRSTAGYGLSLAEGAATVRDGVLTVRVDWGEPPPGALLAQVMTSPCLLVKMPAASFERIRVVDQQGQVRLEGVR